MFHVFSLVWFLIHGEKSRSGHDLSQSFDQISHISGPKTETDFLMKWLDDSAWFCMEELKKHSFEIKTPKM